MCKLVVVLLYIIKVLYKVIYTHEYSSILLSNFIRMLTLFKLVYFQLKHNNLLKSIDIIRNSFCFQSEPGNWEILKKTWDLRSFEKKNLEKPGIFNN